MISHPEDAATAAATLYREDRGREAEGVLESALGRWPGDERLHLSLARLRWQRGAGREATAMLEQAVAARPGDHALRLSCADLLRCMGAEQDALDLVMEGHRRAPDSPAFLTSIGVLLDCLGRFDEALSYFHAAVRANPARGDTKRNLLPALLRAGRPEEALTIARELQLAAPMDQHLIAHEALALRQLDASAYRELYDYDRLVRCFELEPPAGFRTIGEFNQALADALVAKHRGQAHPLDQSLRGGTQTDRQLWEFGDPTVEAFLRQLREPIEAYVTALQRGSGHPLDRRAGSGFRLSGAWSVRLNPGGFHINHVHPVGWLSSAYYVQLPETFEGGDRAGCLKLGEPPFAQDRFPAERTVAPRSGMLVLFPSYMWHGTETFGGGHARLTAAFDVVPK